MHKIMCSGDAKRELFPTFVGNADYFPGQTILDTVQTYVATRNFFSLHLQLIIV